VPRRLELACHPNPFNPKTFITYRLPERGRVELGVYDVTGRRVALLERGLKSEGEHRATWSGLNESGDPVSTGVYFVRLNALGSSRAEKVVLLK
jgi:flagellar hook assembly protein FlgD